MTVVCHVIPAFRRLVDVDILEPSDSPCFGADFFCTSMEMGRQMVKKLDLKLTLGMAGRRKTDQSPPDEVRISVRPGIT